MSAVIDYQRPSTVDEAVALLSRPGAVLLAGGTRVNAGERPLAGVLIDLQAVGLTSIEVTTTTLRIGAMVRLADLADHEAVPVWIREIARLELPSSLRTLATVGGTVATADWESPLLAALLAVDATVSLRSVTGSAEHRIESVTGDRRLLDGAVITGIELDPSWTGSIQRTARTTADRPIVACVAARHPEHGTRAAFTGVAPTPVVTSDLDTIDTLDPPGDFRGSPSYRRHLAHVLSSRAIADLGA